MRLWSSITFNLVHKAACALACGILLVACSSDDDDGLPRPTSEQGDGTIAFAEMGSRHMPSGADGFAFGVASAATQIEDQNHNVDWWVWTMPEEEGGLGHGFPLGDASMGYTNALEDVQLLKDLGVDVYRFSIEWARVEPQRGVIDEQALEHYDRFIDALVEAGIRPMITLHHFSNPIWVDDPRDPGCDEPSDDNLCGWDHPEGAPLIIEAIAEHAGRLAARYGDRVDEWCTVNEPINYMLAGYGIGYFPPGKSLLISDMDQLISVYRNYLEAHARMVDAIRENDTIDADGDGAATSIGMTLSVAEWAPARNGRWSDDPKDIRATDNVNHVFHHLWVDSLTRGQYDPALDGSWSEEQPTWTDRLDWLGVQYYFRAGVTGSPGLVPRLGATPCATDFDFGSCVPAEDPTHYVPEMGYEYWAPGLYNRLVEFSERWPGLPMTVTESGLSTNVGARRAEHVVRSLEQIHRAIQDGADVRGYFHWTLMDNFEWAEGYGPRFGLFFTDFDGDHSRTPTEAATLLGEIAGQRRLTADQRAKYGGLGPMTPEE